MAKIYDTIDIEAGYAEPGPVSAYKTAGEVVNRYMVNSGALDNKTTAFKFYSLNTDKNQ